MAESVVRTIQDVGQMNEQLLALRDAVLAISSDLSLTEVLHRIVRAAALLGSARYAALGVPDDTGRMLAEFVTEGLSPEEVALIAHPPKGRGLLGLIMREHVTVRVREISAHPLSVGFPPGHPPMGSFLGVPILYKGRCLGNLYLTDKIGAEEFTVGDENQIEWLASHAAIAIENARLYEEVQRLTVIEERQRIGMDLHDGVIQSIYAVGLQLEFIRALLEDGETTQAHDRMGTAIDALNNTIRDIRSYILDLRPHSFQGNDLNEGLRRLTADFKANSLVATELQLSAEANSLVSPESRLALFQITQEALANVAKHARATKVLVRFSPGAEGIVLEIRDNGRGLPPDGAVKRMGHGLTNMAQRAQTIGAEFNVASEPGKGTRIQLRLRRSAPDGE
ncbi:MAG: GAF domain-containing sensor histidine kinase [Chloroflexi bacterium]|nr:GAF domain-containing sensor histidine kinase [Chloroflexota bacterium]